MMNKDGTELFQRNPCLSATQRSHIASITSLTQNRESVLTGMQLTAFGTARP